VHCAGFSLLPEQWFAYQNYARALTASPLPRYQARLDRLYFAGGLIRFIAARRTDS
jgi:hypothetical protein